VPRGFRFRAGISFCLADLAVRERVHLRRQSRGKTLRFRERLPVLDTLPSSPTPRARGPETSRVPRARTPPDAIPMRLMRAAGRRRDDSWWRRLAGSAHRRRSAPLRPLVLRAEGLPSLGRAFRVARGSRDVASQPAMRSTDFCTPKPFRTRAPALACRPSERPMNRPPSLPKPFGSVPVRANVRFARALSPPPSFPQGRREKPASNGSGPFDANEAGENCASRRASRFRARGDGSRGRCLPSVAAVLARF
jgi:hypothetical protein